METTPSGPSAELNETPHDEQEASPAVTAATSTAPQNDPILVVKPGPPSAVSTSAPASDDPASQNRMDASAFRELAQMVGAMVFVGLLTVAGWHAAHYSGAWPY
ncbi:MAG: hypothetical protein ABF876_04460 [Acetobacter aceti]|uniref:hypothetical protein n=1 Tax=Acetobacter aceti TaxID=435 RepID=UPI0011EA54D7|nr:hypothetical protein [Acetobacter aceti]